MSFIFAEMLSGIKNQKQFLPASLHFRWQLHTYTTTHRNIVRNNIVIVVEEVGVVVAYLDCHVCPALGEDVEAVLIEGYVVHDAPALPRRDGLARQKPL